MPDLPRVKGSLWGLKTAHQKPGRAQLAQALTNARDLVERGEVLQEAKQFVQTSWCMLNTQRSNFTASFVDNHDIMLVSARSMRAYHMQNSFQAGIPGRGAVLILGGQSSRVLLIISSIQEQTKAKLSLSSLVEPGGVRALSPSCPVQPAYQLAAALLPRAYLGFSV